MKIKLKPANNFKPMAYPACDKSKLLSQLIRKKTLSPKDIAILEEIGFEIEYEDTSIRILPTLIELVSKAHKKEKDID